MFPVFWYDLVFDRREWEVYIGHQGKSTEPTYIYLAQWIPSAGSSQPSDVIKKIFSDFKHLSLTH